MPSIIDLYSGAGGLSLGASRAGFNIAAAIELDSYAISTHKINFPNTVHVEKDITMLNASELLECTKIKQADLTGIIGGPPCQGFSSIGHGNVDDSRNMLFVKFFQLVGDLRPIFYLAENVPGILNKKYNEIRALAFSYVRDYVQLPPMTLNASEYGAPTTRARTFFIGYLADAGIDRISVDDVLGMRVKKTEKTNVRQALEGLPGDIHYKRNTRGMKKLEPNYLLAETEHIQSQFFYHRITRNKPNGVGNEEYCNLYYKRHIINGCIPTQHTVAVKRRFSKLAYGQRDNISKCMRLDPNGYCPTLRAGTGPDRGSYQAVRPVHFNYDRVITPREAARLQGFPDWFMLPDTIWHAFRQIGNSVSPIISERILSLIYQKLT